MLAQKYVALLEKRRWAPLLVIAIWLVLGKKRKERKKKKKKLTRSH
jgi:hypothetical protein